MNPINFWIDITNSPHVLFFNPLIKEIKSRNHTINLTARDFSETLPLLDKFGIEYKLVGKHNGMKFQNKIRGLFERSFKLIQYSSNKKIDIALSHNSNDIAIASLIRSIPLVTMFDYEYASSHYINLRIAKKIIIPEYIRNSSLYKYGAKDWQISKYSGLKEQIYLRQDQLESSFDDRLKIDESKVIILLRPPAVSAHYHSNIDSSFYISILKYLSKRDDVQVFIIPRNESQERIVNRFKDGNFVIPKRPINLPQLAHKSDLVISGGGTVIREAVALGTPAYTIFKPKMGDVDRYLIKQGLLNHLINVKDLDIKKKVSSNILPPVSPKKIVDMFESVLNQK